MIEGYERENSLDLDEMLFSMNSEEFLENEVLEQISNLFESNKIDYLSSYISKYKYYKKEYEENEDFVEGLKERKIDTVKFIIEVICEKFSIDIDVDDYKTKIAKTLYKFFVIDYKENLITFFINYINSNKKAIVAEIKSLKRGRDISNIVSKSKFANNNDALIINNINYILLDLITSMTEDDSNLDLVIDADDDVTSLNLRDLLNNEIIKFNGTFSMFVGPFIEKEDGYSEIVSEIVLRLSQDAKLLPINIFE